MTRSQLERIRAGYFSKIPYELQHYTLFNYGMLRNILYITRRGKCKHDKYADCIIMADTETSRKSTAKGENHVCAWTISIRAYSRNICTLWGSRPSDLITTLANIRNNIECDKMLVYFHNLSYDWQFIRKFCFADWGRPSNQLNTKPHYPISIDFENGITFRDSLILSQRSLDKWGKDMQVEHQKACGKWDYDKIRNQSDSAECFTEEELEYIEHDTLCGVECIDAFLHEIKKHICHAPYTATGIVRDEVFHIGEDNNAKQKFNSLCLDYEQYNTMLKVYHGGYTHANRFAKNTEWGRDFELVESFDFASSYPFCICAYDEYPIEKFFKAPNHTPQEMLKEKNYCFIFRLVAVGVKLKNEWDGMPTLQLSKCVRTVNAAIDNGRITAADCVEIWLNNIDLEVIYDMYTFDHALCLDCQCARKGSMPKWLTDYVYNLFKAKTTLKGGDPVAYAMAKAKINSVYGMHVQRSIRPDIKEDYDSGEFYICENQNNIEKYEKYLKNYKSILPYQWGVWVTSLAFRNLFELGKCAGIWLYSDTDSCYGMNWNYTMIEAYNTKCKHMLTRKGYTSVEHNGREYWLGVAEPDNRYTSFKCIHAKCYAGIQESDGKMHITVAGVPKKGAECLSDLEQFKAGFVFPGTATGKKLHTYYYRDEIYIDANGNETGDSIDLSPCDYIMSDIECLNWTGDELNEEITIRVYEEDLAE